MEEQATFDRADADHLVGTVIGKFRIESVIASGGMGTVYKAFQEQPVRRPVALKMIKAGLADSSTLSRFIAERQVLALMDHPDIARVYEADAISINKTVEFRSRKWFTAAEPKRGSITAW